MTDSKKYRVKIGDTIKNNTPSEFVTYRYDFIPESVDPNANANIITDFIDKTITIEKPNLPGSIQTKTIYKGKLVEANRKECIMNFNKSKDEYILERVGFVANLKMVRDACSTKAPVKVLKEKGSCLSDSSDDDFVTKNQENDITSFSIKNPVDENEKRLSDTESFSDSSSEDESGNIVQNQLNSLNGNFNQEKPFEVIQENIEERLSDNSSEDSVQNERQLYNDLQLSSSSSSDSSSDDDDSDTEKVLKTQHHSNDIMAYSDEENF